MPLKAASLNSTDVYVLETPKALFLWSGKGSSGDEREFGKTLAKQVSPGKEAQAVLEGKEPAEFWSTLGGKAAYANVKEAQVGSVQPRLFQCSNARGYFYVEEIFDFDQEVCVTISALIYVIAFLIASHQQNNHL